MSTGYQVIGPYVNGDVISATLFNNDFGAIAAAMHQTTGHDHDGTTGGGAPIAKIGDADFNNKIEIDGTNNKIKMFLEVGGSSTEVLNVSENELNLISSSAPQITLINTDDIVNSGQLLGAINFYNSDPANAGPHNVVTIEARAHHQQGYGGDLFFKTNDGSNAEPQTVMQIGNQGYVFIGNDNVSLADSSTDAGVTIGTVSRMLQVSAANGAPAAFNRNNEYGEIVKLYTQGNELGVLEAHFNDLVISNRRNDERVILEVRAADGTAHRIGVEPDDNVAAFKPLNADSDDYFDLGSSTERFKNLYLSNTGYFETSVGIGSTSTPSYELDVTGSAQLTGGDLILRSDSSDADTQYIRFENYPTDSRTAYIRADYTSQTSGGGTELAFGTNDHDTATDTDSMVIDREGNVGIGASPYYKFDVAGDSISARLRSQTGNTNLYLHTLASDGSCNLYFGGPAPDSTNKSGAIEYDPSTHKMSFDTDSTERMSIDSTGDVTIKNDLIVEEDIRPEKDIAASGNNVFRIRNKNVPTNPSTIEMYSYSSGLNDIVIRSDPLRSAGDTEKFRVTGTRINMSNIDYASIENGLYVRSITAAGGTGDVSGNAANFSVIHAASGTDKGYSFHGSADSTTRGCRVKLEQDADTTTDVIIGSIDFVGRPSGISDTVYSQITSTVTDAAGTEAELKLDSDTLYVTGDVGIGTDSPDAKLHVQGGVIQADGGLLISETARLEIGDNAFGGNNTSLSTNSSGVATFQTYNNFTIASTNNLILAGNGNIPLVKGNKLNAFGDYEVSLHYGTAGYERLITTSGGINVTGDITLSGTVDGVDIATLGANAIVDGDFTSNGFMKRTGAGTYAIDSNTYLTTHQDISGKADLSGADFTGDVTAKSKLIAKKCPVASDLLTTSRSTQDLAAWSVYAGTASNYALTPEKYRDALDANKDNQFGSSDSYALLLFVTDNYTSQELSTYQSLLNNQSNITSTFVQDVLDGDYDTDGVIIDKNASSLVTINGDTVVSGTVEAEDVIVYETQAEAVSPLLTADRTPEELADLYVAALLNGGSFDPLAGIPDYQLPLLNFNGQTSSGDMITSMDAAAVETFIDDASNGYTSTEISNFDTYIATSPYSYRSIILNDIRRGDYDYLIAPAKVGINTETPASALDVIGDISVSGNITSDLSLNLTPTKGIEMRAGNADGIEMHWWAQSADASALSSEQTKRLHITSRGIHVGDDVTGTYTAGDLQNNRDIDFGFLVGRESDNYGSNNVGIGFDLMFDTNSASNFGQGSVIDMHGASTNCVAFGGNLRLGTELLYDTGPENSFIGGLYASTEGSNTFTWAEGVLAGGTIHRAENDGKGSVLFGKQGQIDADSTYSLLGGQVGAAPEYIEPSLIDSSYAFSWGLGNVVDDSNASVVCGQYHSVDGAANSLVAGEYHEVLGSNAFVAGTNNETTAVDAATAIGKNNKVEGNYSVAIGKDNNSLGEAGVCLGQGLKTPLFENNGNYEWNNYSTVVGGYNDPTEKYYTASDNSTWVEDHRFVVGTGTSAFTTDNGFIVAVPTSDFSGVIMPALAASTSHANDTAAKAAGVPVGGLYHTNGVVKVVL
jgi:hypothetical protein